MKLTRQTTRLLAATALSFGLLFAFFGVVSAHTTVASHAKVTKAIPAIGSTISTAPTTVTVFTAENMKTNVKDSNLFVYGPSGDLISTGDAKFDINNPQTMSVTIKPEKDGIYVVRWNNVSSNDGDPDQGAFTFTVKSSAAAGATSTPAQKTPATSSGTPVWVPILVGIVALLLGLGAGIALGRNRRPAAAVAPTASNKVVPEAEETSRRP